MTTVSFLASDATVTGEANAVTYTLGIKFASSVAGTITAVRFWHPATAPTSPVPNALAYDASGNELARVAFGTLTAGWNTATFGTPVPVSAGADYTVAVYGGGYARATFPAASGPLTLVGGFYTAGTNVYPTTPISPLPSVDVTFAYTGPSITRWDGTTEVPMTLTRWDGSVEGSMTLEIAP